MDLNRVKKKFPSICFFRPTLCSKKYLKMIDKTNSQSGSVFEYTYITRFRLENIVAFQLQTKMSSDMNLVASQLIWCCVSETEWEKQENIFQRTWQLSYILLGNTSTMFRTHVRTRIVNRYHRLELYVSVYVYHAMHLYGFQFCLRTSRTLISCGFIQVILVQIIAIVHRNLLSVLLAEVCFKKT